MRWPMWRTCGSCPPTSEPVVKQVVVVVIIAWVVVHTENTEGIVHYFIFQNYNKQYVVGEHG